MIAFVALARTTFDMALAAEQTDRLRAHLQRHAQAAGISFNAADGLITDLDAVKALRLGKPSLVVALQATFADSSMAVALAEQVEAPLLLWALPEPQVGGRLRLNSLCGINLAAFALRQRGKRFSYVYAEPDDSAALQKVILTARAAGAMRLLRRAAIGVVGQHPAGFEPCAYDARALRSTFGLEVKAYDLNAMFARADAVPADRVDARYRMVAAQLGNLEELNTASVRGTLSFYEALRDVVEADDLNGLAVRCWPETFVQRDCAVCAASSLFTDSGIPASCEADVNGSVTSLILQALSGEPAFGADLVAADAQRNTVVFWHCGLAPLSMCDPEFQPRGTLHSNRQRPLLMEFPLKPGRATVARLTQAGTGDSQPYRLVVGSGEMLRAPMQFTGTSGVFRFDTPVPQVLDTIMREGLDHHYSITYGDHGDALLIFADLAGLPVIRL